MGLLNGLLFGSKYGISCVTSLWGSPKSWWTARDLHERRTLQVREVFFGFSL